MAKTIKFNTGRPYNADGQMIIATLHDDGVVTFMDHARGVDGMFSMGTAYLDHFDAAELQREIMARYDHYEAPNSARSWADGMSVGGCNTRAAFVAYTLAQAATAPLMAQPVQQAQAAKAGLRELLAERRAMRAQGLAGQAQAICRVITAKARELAFDRAALVRKAAKLIAGDYAERNLFAYWSSNDASELEAFCEGAGLTPDEYKARA